MKQKIYTEEVKKLTQWKQSLPYMGHENLPCGKNVN